MGSLLDAGIVLTRRPYEMYDEGVLAIEKICTTVAGHLDDRVELQEHTADWMLRM